MRHSAISRVLIFALLASLAHSAHADSKRHKRAVKVRKHEAWQRESDREMVFAHDAWLPKAEAHKYDLHPELQPMKDMIDNELWRLPESVSKSRPSKPGSGWIANFKFPDECGGDCERYSGNTRFKSKSILSRVEALGRFDRGAPVRVGASHGGFDFHFSHSKR